MPVKDDGRIKRELFEHTDDKEWRTASEIYRLSRGLPHARGFSSTYSRAINSLLSEGYIEAERQFTCAAGRPATFYRRAKDVFYNTKMIPNRTYKTWYELDEGCKEEAKRFYSGNRYPWLKMSHFVYGVTWSYKGRMERLIQSERVLSLPVEYAEELRRKFYAKQTGGLSELEAGGLE